MAHHIKRWDAMVAHMKKREITQHIHVVTVVGATQISIRQKGEPMFEVPYGQDPYSAIGRYIRENITAIEDIIAVIDIDGVETNELFMVDMEEDGFFIWNSDWYEGEKKVVLIDFFPVSEAINPSEQPDVLDTNVGDTISRQSAIDAVNIGNLHPGIVEALQSILAELPPATPQQKIGHWIVDGSVNCYLDKVRCHCSECGKKKEFPADYDHIKRELSISYEYLEFIDNYCPNCGAKMVEAQADKEKEE